MKSMILVVLALVVCAAAAPTEILVKPKQPQIIRSEFVQQPEGSYVFRYETDDGVIREEYGEVKEVLDEDNKLRKVVIVHGSYTFPDEEGKPQTITYFADETGYHAEGKALPKIIAETQVLA